MTTLCFHEIGIDDIAAADAVLMDSFLPPQSRETELRRYLALPPGCWLLAELDGQAVGMAGAKNYGPFAQVGLVAVRQAMQRRGIGAALVEQVLTWLDERGCPTATLDASPAGAPLYARYGFAEIERTIRYIRDDCATIPASAQHVAHIRAEDVPAVAAFDAPIFGAQREDVLALFVRDHPGRAFVVHDQRGAVSGYLIAQKRQLGPWAAASLADAEALLAAALPLFDDGPLRVTAPDTNQEVGALLLRAGFSPQASLRHMRRGPPLDDRRALLYGQASLAIG